ncbi:PREDICTED: uncharacterized protein LOC105562203 [Vollenhovia emeryi]|uniref:uncharacterized protein LOC105562203 n=1 Tax=Vollenhovia emeryi TaxID=411798 RepID=UPI0005F57E07|nr:PREDICTED: uncharacterized protein LOC105562203 [Vollenhovia emeryi]
MRILYVFLLLVLIGSVFGKAVNDSNSEGLLMIESKREGPSEGSNKEINLNDGGSLGSNPKEDLNIKDYDAQDGIHNRMFFKSYKLYIFGLIIREIIREILDRIGINMPPTLMPPTVNPPTALPG